MSETPVQFLILIGDEQRSFVGPATVQCMFGRAFVIHWCSGCTRKADRHKDKKAERVMLHLDLLNAGESVSIDGASQPWDVVAGECGATVALETARERGEQ